MGQRQQIFIFIKNDKGETIGRAFHHQWLYGYWAGKKAEVVMCLLRGEPIDTLGRECVVTVETLCTSSKTSGHFPV